jgi:hypothetical protein
VNMCFAPGRFLFSLLSFSMPIISANHSLAAIHHFATSSVTRILYSGPVFAQKRRSRVTTAGKTSSTAVLESLADWPASKTQLWVCLSNVRHRLCKQQALPLFLVVRIRGGRRVLSACHSSRAAGCINRQTAKTWPANGPARKLEYTDAAHKCRRVIQKPAQQYPRNDSFGR